MIDVWKTRDNSSRPRHQELVDGLNAVLPQSVEGDLNQYSTPQGRGIVGTGGFPLIPQEIPLKIGAPIDDGRYSLKMGRWKAQVPEAGGITLDDLFDFPAADNAVGIVLSEIIAADGVHHFTADDIVFGFLQPSTTDSKKQVLTVPVSTGIIDIRYSPGTHTIDVTFDGTTWIPKITFVSCATDTTVTT